MIPKILEFIVRRGGRKFLDLNENFDGAMFDGKNRYGASLYVHIPFCKKICPYCSFNRYLFKEDSAKKYFKNLKKEIDSYIDKNFKFTNFYFGGGTPTVMMHELIGFIDYLNENFSAKQISLETNPSDVNDENVNLLKNSGVKRLSIGVQSFDDEILKSIGRAHTGEDAQEKILIAKGSFDTTNIDLMFNFPSQSIDKFRGDIKIFKGLGMEQVTFYPLMPSPNKRNAMERRFNKVDTSREKGFYDVILEQMNAYKPSTVWCFSKGERIIDEYIIDFDDYIGIGAGSVSFLDGTLYVNSFSLEKYGKLLNKGKFPIVRWKRLSEREFINYYFLTKLFGMGFDNERFRGKFNSDVRRKLRKELLFLKFFGIINEDNGKIEVTEKGMYCVNVMMREFFSSLNGLREYCIENKI